MPAILAIDQGTTSTRAIAFNLQGQVLAVAQQELPQIYPQSGWVEHDPEIIWQHTLAVGGAVLEKVPDIEAIGITNQRETSVIWDRESGEVIYNAIVWQDRRGAPLCEKLRKDGYEKLIQEKTGLVVDSYFSATKIVWILDHVSDARKKAEQGKLAFGTIDCFLLWRLTGKHKTDATNASRTMLYNIHEHRWDAELLSIFNIPSSLLPEIADNDHAFGETQKWGKKLPITGMAGDQHAALIGQACLTPGSVKSTYGTGCFALVNIGAKPSLSRHRLLTTLGYKLANQTAYALEGSIFVAGAAVQWLRDGIGTIARADESEKLAESLESNQGVYLVPAFTGLGTPYWEPDVRGALFGLTRDTGRAELARAALESVAYQTRDLIHAMQADMTGSLNVIRIDGGMVKNNWLCQFMSDILDLPVERPAMTETTAWGAACCAALGAGLYTSLTNITENWQSDRIFSPQMSAQKREEYCQGWERSIKAVRARHAS